MNAITRFKTNKYKKANIKVGDRKKLLNYDKNCYEIVEVKQILNKGNYNMYICKILSNGFTTTFTDKDLLFKNIVKDVKRKEV